MPNVPVDKLKEGQVIVAKVTTKLGSTLFEKGVVIGPREIEILTAFEIESVVTNAKQDDKSLKEESNRKAKQHMIRFHESYEGMVKLARQVFHLARSGGSFPILEIRTRLEDLLHQIEFYNPLVFVPKRMNPKESLLHNGIMCSLTSFQLAKWCNYPSKDLIPIALGALLHDVGNAKINTDVLGRPLELTTAELEEVRRHTIYGYNILKNVPAINEGAKLVALQHHEREDGSGYPLGLKSEKIHPYAKIVAIADIYHAMTSKRRNNKASSPYLVLEKLLDESFGKLEPNYVKVFIDNVTRFQNGTLVKLSDNRMGEVMFSDRLNPTRPMVNVNGTIINLALDREIYIEAIIGK